MRISIIVSIYKNGLKTEKLLNILARQTSDHYEVIFVVDTNAENSLVIVNDAYSHLGDKLKVIYNSKRQNHKLSIESAIQLASGDYSIIISANTAFDTYFVEKINYILERKTADIIEFPLSFSGAIKTTIKPRRTISIPVEISENPAILSYIMPFEFNKLIKTTILRRLFKEKYNTYLGSKFSLEISYKSLLISKTYQTTSKTLLTTHIDENDFRNPLSIIADWSPITKFAEKQFSGNIDQELQYAKFYLQNVFISALVKEYKIKALSLKFKSLQEKNKQNIFDSFFETNKYILENSFETTTIKNFRDNEKYYKLVKALNSKNAK